MKCSKRAGLHISLSLLIDLVIVTLALLVLYGIYSGIVSIFAGNQDKQVATRNNFNNLVAELNSMVAPETKEIPVYIGADWFVIGFGRQQTVAQGCLGMTKAVTKPPTCTEICLCLCTTSDACRTKVECKKLEGDFELKGTNCEYANIAGMTNPQIIKISKQKDIVKIGLKQ